MTHHNDHDTTPSYRIRRFYQGDKPTETIKTGLTQAEAQAWCNDPETSSATATSAEAQERTAKHGPWFDGWEAEETGSLDGWPNWATREVALWLLNTPDAFHWTRVQVADARATHDVASMLAASLAEHAPAFIRSEGSTITDEECITVDWHFLAGQLLGEDDA